MRRNDNLDPEVAAIGGLSREELIARWQKTYGCPPPKGINRPLLERSAAWHLQAKCLGGLSAAAQAALHVGPRSAAKAPRSAYQSAKDANVGTGGGGAGCAGASLPLPDLPVPVRKRPARRLPIGTRLMREWNGRMHVVDVTAQGILFDGNIYRSLSSIAKRITGAHWSGPRFFGL